MLDRELARSVDRERIRSVDRERRTWRLSLRRGPGGGLLPGRCPGHACLLYIHVTRADFFPKYPHTRTGFNLKSNGLIL